MTPPIQAPLTPDDYAVRAGEAWIDAFRARAEGDDATARRLMSLSGRYASVARRLGWVPEDGAHG